jgi:Ca2+-binding EF-hand superfamily protein
MQSRSYINCCAARTVTYRLGCLSQIDIDIDIDIVSVFVVSMSFSVLAFKEVFDLFDEDGGGTIDAEELDNATKSVDCAMTPEEIAEVLSIIDEDGKQMP